MFEVLDTEYLDIGGIMGPSIKFKSSEFVSSIRLSEYYRIFHSKTRQYQTTQFSEIKIGIDKCCPSARKVRKSKNENQERGYQLPSLTNARNDFEDMIGHKIW